MNGYLKRLAALLSASFAYSSSVDAREGAYPDTQLVDDDVDVSLLNVTVSDRLAAHRSHQSHQSHGSHRSSSGGGTYTPAPVPRPAPPPAPPAVPSQKRQPTQADPLGQQPRPPESYPSKQKPSLSEALKDKERRKNVIMRVQLTLQFEGYYDGPIDGVMGPQTRESVLAYKKARGIPGDTVLDAETLNALGVLGY